jgi:Ca2+-transporting ATPase
MFRLRPGVTRAEGSMVTRPQNNGPISAPDQAVTALVTEQAPRDSAGQIGGRCCGVCGDLMQHPLPMREHSDMMVVSALDPHQVLAALKSSDSGLPSAEAAARREVVGPNRLPAARGRAVLAEFGSQFANMFAVVLVVAAGITFLAYALSTPSDAATLELAFGIIGVVLLNAVIGFAQEHAAERTAEALQAMVPSVARVIRDGELTEIAAVELVPGDLVVLDAGDAISADCRLIEAHDLQVEMAALTGESRPTPRISEAVQEGPIADARNCVFMGTSVVNGSGKAVVFATGLNTEFGRIYRLTAEVPREDSPLQREVTVMARRVAMVAIVAGAGLFAIRAVASGSMIGSFVFALGVMVALVPEGLPATMSVSLAVAVRRMARRNALIKRLTAVETLGSTTVICTDKTGTLTKAEMTVQAVWESGREHQVTGVGYGPAGEVVDQSRVTGVLRAGGLCSDARLLPPDPQRHLDWRVLGDPTEGAILVAAAKGGVDLAAEADLAPRVATFPFDADRKLMSTIHRLSGGSYEACVKGSPQAILERCVAVEWHGRQIVLDGALREQVAAANDAMAADGLRVLAVARRDVATGHPPSAEAERELTLLGLVAMSDPPRPEVVDAVAACRRAGIRLYMITGDYGLTAEAIARRVGIIGDGPVRILSGSDLDAMDDNELAGEIRQTEQLLFARAKPEHKMRVVAALEDRGEVVAVTGDGVNDAPALKRAGIGVSMGEGGTDVARAASVMILLDDSFASIAAAVELGRTVYQNIRKFLIYLFSHNLAELAPILVAVFVGFPLVPLSALQVLAIDLGSDVMPALALGTERTEPGTMSRPPRPPREHLFNWAVVRRFCFLGSIQSAGVVAAFFWRIHTAHLPFSAFTAENPTYREALTMTQAGIVVSQFFNSFAVRTQEQSIVRVGVFSNKPLVFAGLFGILIISGVSYIPALQSVFNTAPLTTTDWIILISLGAVVLLADETRKAVLRSARRTRRTGQSGMPARVMASVEEESCKS